LVPVKNGSIPEAPDGGHSSQAGTLPEPPAVAADDPPEPGCPDEKRPAPADGAAVIVGNPAAPEGFVRPVPVAPVV
jgi:hypothetical protein